MFDVAIFEDRIKQSCSCSVFHEMVLVLMLDRPNTKIPGLDLRHITAKELH